MNVIAEFLAGMRAVWGVLCFRSDAFTRFDNTPSGVARSFLAAAVGFPVYVLVLQANFAAMTPRPQLASLLPLMICYYVIEWLIWPNVMVGVARRLGRQQFYCRYIAAYNWFALTQMLIMLPYQLSMTSGTLPPAPELAFVGFVTTLAFGVYEWFIARHGLEIPPRGAFGLVILNLLVGLALLWFKAFQLHF